MAEEQKHAAEQVVEDVPEETSAASASVAAAAAAQGISPAMIQKQQSAAERKARKAMLKKGFEQVDGVSHISVLRKKSPMFSISSPDVYKNAGSDTWIVFGEARVDNFGRMGGGGAQRAARASAAASQGIDPKALLAEASAADEASAAAPADDDEEVDEAGVDSSDIELVVTQANCSRAAAVKALKANGNDVVNAIMEITN
ncbi:hypothetical protein IWQ56_000963 [Coemansia nantahalensis]|uniref:Uncharacterized protein n=2 Tax=Coemansia TaxID=4863 RepID=A0ACC1LI35_9FUNG|nr:hypothetical protein IWQ56_000963 [Coemansia nantahalensis]KAJ2775574.1 hypothetical protein IWQ57_000364 [Coemansia nantahalensis]KAJ2808221.1 hypothetical protein H4R21_000146 [Coemansia helicoidea]